MLVNNRHPILFLPSQGHRNKTPPPSRYLTPPISASWYSISLYPPRLCTVVLTPNFQKYMYTKSSRGRTSPSPLFANWHMFFLAPLDFWLLEHISPLHILPGPVDYLEAFTSEAKSRLRVTASRFGYDVTLFGWPGVPARLLCRLPHRDKACATDA
ncbi:hypothetical protein PMIN04_010823 [Paraphaeosphaeria minitans]